MSRFQLQAENVVGLRAEPLNPVQPAQGSGFRVYRGSGFWPLGRPVGDQRRLKPCGNLVEALNPKP